MRKGSLLTTLCRCRPAVKARKMKVDVELPTLVDRHAHPETDLRPARLRKVASD